jgi:hypothetical protein
MGRAPVGHVRLGGICLASLLLLLAVALTACGVATVDTGAGPDTTTPTAAAVTPSSQDATTSSFPVPVSSGDYGGDWLGTTSTGSGPADLYCSVAFAATQPTGTVYVSLSTEAGEFIDGRDGRDGAETVDGNAPWYTFKGIQPGKYRLAVYGSETGYISQWYGGLTVQGHDILESKVLELRPGRNLVEFTLQPGLSIQGEISWTQGAPTGGFVQAYDLQGRNTGRTASIGGEELMQPGTGYRFLIVGLLPGRYRIGASFDAAFAEPQVWDGGGPFEDAPVIDLTSGDVAGVHLELGALPATTTTTSLQ